MDEEVYKKYKLAGSIAAKARDYGANLVKAGKTLLEVAEKVEKKIEELGGKPAFPVNISINDVAAHFTPKKKDLTKFQPGDVVKIDVGVHIDGYIADTATTVEVETDRYGELIDASREALENAIKTIKAGIRLRELGKIISETIKKRGYRAIDNLSGHNLQRYLLHAGLSIPNVPEFSLTKLDADEVIAVEPFATDGAGHVISGKESNIYRLVKFLPKSRDKTRIYAGKLRKLYSTLPFAERWLEGKFTNPHNLLEDLVRKGYVISYSQLIEKGRGMVSQHEHTVIVTEEGCEVIT